MNCHRLIVRTDHFQFLAHLCATNTVIVCLPKQETKTDQQSYYFLPEFVLLAVLSHVSLYFSRYSAIGKVASGHQAPIICLSIHNSKNGGENLITGSKDHLIKLFDLSSEQTNNCLIQPKFTLEPPHYDGVQCLAHRGNVLFSGSRDMCIKKWDLNEPTLQPLVCQTGHIIYCMVQILITSVIDFVSKYLETSNNASLI